MGLSGIALATGTPQPVKRAAALGTAVDVARADHVHDFYGPYAKADFARTAQAPGTVDEVLDQLAAGANSWLNVAKVRARILGTALTNLVAFLRLVVTDSAGAAQNRDSASGTSGVTAQFLNLAASQPATGNLFAAPAWAAAEAAESLGSLLSAGDKITAVQLVGKRSNTTNTVQWDLQVSGYQAGGSTA